MVTPINASRDQPGLLASALNRFPDLADPLGEFLQPEVSSDSGCFKIKNLVIEGGSGIVPEGYEKMPAGKVHRAETRQCIPQGIAPVQTQGRMMVALPCKPGLRIPDQGSEYIRVVFPANCAVQVKGTLQGARSR